MATQFFKRGESCTCSHTRRHRPSGSYKISPKKKVAGIFSQQSPDLLPLLCKSGFTCGFHRVLGTLHFRKIASPAQANKSLVKPQLNGESFGLLQFYTHSVSLGLFAGTIHKTGWKLQPLQRAKHSTIASSARTLTCITGLVFLYVFQVHCCWQINERTDGRTDERTNERTSLAPRAAVASALRSSSRSRDKRKTNK